MSITPRVAIVYLCHNDFRYVPEIVKSWESLIYPKENFTIIMVPNGAIDGVQTYIKKEILPKADYSLPKIEMIDDGVNRGFAGGNNLGISWALAHDFDYVFLQNGDLKLDSQAITKLVEVMKSAEDIASAQALILYWHDQQKINATGGVIHIAGYGYAKDNGKMLTQIQVLDKSEIAYASGAAVMYRASALKKVGLLEEGFFMYHEDLELGLRLRLAGYKNVLATEARAFHDYSFSRNPKKFMWMEMYRWVILFSYLKFKTFILLTPLLFAIEIGVWLMAIKGRWLGAKIRASILFWSWRNLKLIVKMRQRAQKLRVIPDKIWLALVSGRIEDQGLESRFMKIINDVIEYIWKIVRKEIDW